MDSKLKKTQLGVLVKLVALAGIEPASWVPETHILSIVLQSLVATRFYSGWQRYISH